MSSFRSSVRVQAAERLIRENGGVWMNRMLFKSISKTFLISISRCEIEPPIYWAEKAEESGGEPLILVSSDQQYQHAFKALQIEDILFLCTKNVHFRKMALAEFGKIETICLYGGENPAEIISRLSWNDPKTENPKQINNRVQIEAVDRCRIDLAKLRNVSAIGSLFAEVHTIEVVVTRFSSEIKLKLFRALEEYRETTKLRRLILIVEDANEEHQLSEIINFIRKMKGNSVQVLHIIHSGNKTKANIKPWKVIEKIEVPKLPKGLNAKAKESCRLM